MPADSYTHSYYNSSVQAPNLYYFSNVFEDTLEGRLVMYYNPIDTTSGDRIRGRYRIQANGGSGTGNTDECASWRGPLPVGYYGRGDGDLRSRFDLVYAPDSDATISGWVWALGSKRCNGPSRTERTGLYIHSQGASGWNGDYSTWGCIKINQVDRGFMADQYRTAYSNRNGRLRVNATG